MAKKWGLVLGAGGSRGVAHAGFIKALEEENIFPDYITGSSMGAVVGSCYALGLTADFMKGELLSLKPRKLIDLSFAPFRNKALLRSKKVRKKMHSYLGDVTFDQLKIPFRCVSVDVISGKTKVFSSAEKVLDGVLASSAIPCVFKPVAYEDMLLVDGGLKCRLPIDEIRDMGAEVVVVIDVLGDFREMKGKKRLPAMLFRTLDVYDTALAKEKLKNQSPDLYLEPNLGDMSQYKFKKLDFAFEKGYELGKEAINKIKQLIL
ncbi:MAG: patatin-like phospholipase family protein [Clostridia bacterium]|nr:patatin-like phospholipase family protein [Clostridia bacterium]